MLAETLDERKEYVVPSLHELREEILSGPVAGQLTPHWTNVFLPPEADPPYPDGDNDSLAKWRAMCASNEVKRNRAGRITPDGAFDLLQALTTLGRLQLLRWIVTTDLIVQAHNEGIG